MADYTPKYLSSGELDQTDPGNIAQYYQLMGGGGGGGGGFGSGTRDSIAQAMMAQGGGAGGGGMPAASAGGGGARYLPGGGLDPNDPGNIARYYEIMGGGPGGGGYAGGNVGGFGGGFSGGYSGGAFGPNGPAVGPTGVSPTEANNAQASLFGQNLSSAYAGWLSSINPTMYGYTPQSNMFNDAFSQFADAPQATQFSMNTPQSVAEAVAQHMGLQQAGYTTQAMQAAQDAADDAAADAGDDGDDGGVGPGLGGFGGDTGGVW